MSTGKLNLEPASGNDLVKINGIDGVYVAVVSGKAFKQGETKRMTLTPAGDGFRVDNMEKGETSLIMCLVVQKGTDSEKTIFFTEDDSKNTCEWLEDYNEYKSQIQYGYRVQLVRPERDYVYTQRNENCVKYLKKTGSTYEIGNIGIVGRHGHLFLFAEKIREGSVYLGKGGKIVFPEFNNTKPEYEALLQKLYWNTKTISHVSTYKKTKLVPPTNEGTGIVEWYSQRLGIGLVILGPYKKGKFDFPAGLVKAKIHWSNLPVASGQISSVKGGDIVKVGDLIKDKDSKSATALQVAWIQKI